MYLYFSLFYLSIASQSETQLATCRSDTQKSDACLGALDVTTERQIHMPLAEIPMSSQPRPQNAYFGNNSVGLNGPGWMMQAH